VSEPLTGETIADSTIRSLRYRMYLRVTAFGTGTKEDRETYAMCESALNEMCNPTRRREARTRLAEIVNALNASGVSP
jgi:hypothetical protein